MPFYGKQYTLTTTATSLTTALALSTSDPTSFRQLDVKAKAGNAADVFLGRSNVTNTPTNAFVDIPAGQSYTAGVVTGPEKIGTTDEVFIVGTANDIAYIAMWA
jgi:hypothetical protein